MPRTTHAMRRSATVRTSIDLMANIANGRRDIAAACPDTDISTLSRSLGIARAELCRRWAFISYAA